MKTLHIPSRNCACSHLQQSTFRRAVTAQRPFTRQLPQRHRCYRVLAQKQFVEEEDELERKMQEFLDRQAEMESGLATAKALGQVIGANVVSEEEARSYCQDIVEVARTLSDKREMTPNELKLIIMIEDPRTKERRQTMGIEDASGVSRDDMAEALVEVMDGKIPKDRLALRELHREFVEWPYLEEAEARPSRMKKSALAEPGMSSSEMDKGWRADQVRPPVGRDPTEAPKSFTDMLPDWMGYGFLYLVTIIPVLIGLSVVAILFFNSLK